VCFNSFCLNCFHQEDPIYRVRKKYRYCIDFIMDIHMAWTSKHIHASMDILVDIGASTDNSTWTSMLRQISIWISMLPWISIWILTWISVDYVMDGNADILEDVHGTMDVHVELSVVTDIHGARTVRPGIGKLVHPFSLFWANHAMKINLIHNIFTFPCATYDT